MAVFVSHFTVTFFSAIATAGVAGSEEMEARTALLLSSVREVLLHPREALHARYDFILLASIHNDRGLPDIGQNRPAIVVEALRNLFLVSHFMPLIPVSSFISCAVIDSLLRSIRSRSQFSPIDFEGQCKS